MRALYLDADRVLGYAAVGALIGCGAGLLAVGVGLVFGYLAISLQLQTWAGPNRAWLRNLVDVQQNWTYLFGYLPGASEQAVR